MKLKIIISTIVGLTLIVSNSVTAKINFTEYDLPNGLHIILHEDHSTPIVAVGVMYHVGSKNEDPSRTGFAHFFEHLLFEGTDHIKRGEYMKLVQSNGGSLNANTTQDRTYYFEQMPSNQLELALWMESERMAFAKIDSTGLEIQRKVVKEEKKQRYDNTPYGQLINTVFENSFKVHPYRWSPIGKEQYIDQASLSEFLNFYKTFYVPNNACLVIGGDFNAKQANEWIAKYFGPIEKSLKPIPRPTEVEPEQTEKRKIDFYDNVQLPGVVLAFHGPKQGTDDAYALEMITTYLSGGASAPFTTQIVDKEKAMQARIFNYPAEDPGVTVAFGICTMGEKPEVLENAILAEIEKVKNKPLSDADLIKIKNQAENGFISQNRKVSGVINNLAEYYTFFQNTNLINTELERYTKITKQDLLRVANKYLTPQNLTVINYLPKTNK